jgi:hypothetical protein
MDGTRILRTGNRVEPVSQIPQPEKLSGGTGCASASRAVTDFKSDVSGGLNRTINVYTANGDLIASYSGKIDIDQNDGGYVKFDYDGKRYVYYNCFVETIADIK